jgi:putative flippase GtrA
VPWTHIAPRWRTLTRFLLVGASGVVVNSIALFALHGLAGVPLVLASALSVELAIAHNFVLNDRWTFGCARRSLLRFLKFNLVCLVGLLVTTSVAWLLVQQAGVNYLVANLAGIGVGMVGNFVANIQWTWKP